MAPIGSEYVCVRRLALARLLRLLGEAPPREVPENFLAVYDALLCLLRPLDEDESLQSPDSDLLRTVLSRHDERRRRSAIALTAVPPIPRRLRETLELLLTGATEKEIASALGLSTHTVHQYVKALYRRFRVTSRARLMALSRDRTVLMSVSGSSRSL